jgi:hypothetical protein
MGLAGFNTFLYPREIQSTLTGTGLALFAKDIETLVLLLLEDFHEPSFAVIEAKSPSSPNRTLLIPRF